MIVEIQVPVKKISFSSKTEQDRIAGRIDYAFENDQRVIGKWVCLDLIDSIEQFNPANRKDPDDMDIKELIFIKGGSIYNYPVRWSRGIVINSGNKTASRYHINEVEGIPYIFLEFKGDDFTNESMNPRFYVFRKVDSEDYSNQRPPRRVDRINYPFAADPKILGEWKSIDYVKSIDSFDPIRHNLVPETLYLKGMSFHNNGMTSIEAICWTKGIIIYLDDKTASKYEIRKITGTDYLFYEWKSGDYIYRNAQPWYYVLKRVIE